MARKLGLLCVFCSIAYCMFTQQKSDYTNINNFVNKMDNNSKTVEESIKRYGEPVSTEQRLAKDFFDDSSEEAVLLFHNYKDARFVFFIDKEKHFLIFWEITGNFAEFSPFLSNNMTINDVKKVFGENIAVPTEHGVRYGADIGNVSFSFMEKRLVRVTWLAEW